MPQFRSYLLAEVLELLLKLQGRVRHVDQLGVVLDLGPQGVVLLPDLLRPHLLLVVRALELHHAVLRVPDLALLLDENVAKRDGGEKAKSHAGGPLGPVLRLRPRVVREHVHCDGSETPSST